MKFDLSINIPGIHISFKPEMGTDCYNPSPKRIDAFDAVEGTNVGTFKITAAADTGTSKSYIRYRTWNSTSGTDVASPPNPFDDWPDACGAFDGPDKTNRNYLQDNIAPSQNTHNEVRATIWSLQVGANGFESRDARYTIPPVTSSSSSSSSSIVNSNSSSSSDGSSSSSDSSSTSSSSGFSSSSTSSDSSSSSSSSANSISSSSSSNCGMSSSSSSGPGSSSSAG